MIGVPDEKWGETIKALVVLAPRQQADEGELIDYCKSRLARLQGAHVRRVPRRARAHRHRQAPEVQAPRTVLGGPGPPGQLSRSSLYGRLPDIHLVPARGGMGRTAGVRSGCGPSAALSDTGR